MKSLQTKSFIAILTIIFVAVSGSAQNIIKLKNGVKVSPEGRPTVELTVYSSNIIRVTKYAEGLSQMPDKTSYSVILTPGKDKFSISEADTDVVLTTENIVAKINRNTGVVSFSNVQGKTLLTEGAQCSVEALTNEADKGRYSISQEFIFDNDEAIFGLGQHHSTKMNQRGADLDMLNAPRIIAIPFFSSEKGYGVYWDNAGRSRFNDSGATTIFSSLVGEGVDYYFMYTDGSQDGVIASIRELSGKATMFPKWTMGFWQCRERYKTSDELCDVLDKMREMELPIDGIVQDWQYWGCDYNWNAMKFQNPYYINKVGDEQWAKYLPNDLKPLAEEYARKGLQPRIKSPQEMIEYVHKHNAHLMITIWPTFGPWTDQYRDFEKMGALLPIECWPNKEVRTYDAFNPEAREVYWSYLRHLYDMGFDAWWTDATEPDHFNPKPSDFDFKTYGGSWKSVKNAFAIATNRGIYEHQRKMNDGKRVFLMTRAGTLGLQHYGTFSWSGDITSNWATFKNQIPSGLNYIACGIPYWNTDIGGFFCWPDKNNPKSPHAQELQVRWMQWGCFLPLMRNHVSSPMVNEIWRYGEPGYWAFDVQKKYIELRYRLLPYIYSNCGDVVQRDGSMIRPLVFDFAHDRKAINLNDEYMFGRNLLVKPVTDPLYTYQDDQRNGHTIYPEVERAAAPVSVYLPKGAEWYDFWSNRRYKGGQTIKRLAPIDIIPVFVKAGSIIPFGPKVQYSDQKPWDNLEIRVYPGADGEFIFYEDEGDGYNYEKGAFSEITFRWNERRGTLTISDRKGSFEGMLESRKFRVLLVDGDAPSGDKEPVLFSQEVEYSGKEIVLQLAPSIIPADYEEVTGYITNPSFEDDGKAFDYKTPSGWTINRKTSWWGVNLATVKGNPAATDGEYIYGVWDGANDITVSISQVVKNLPKGEYFITVDMHASNNAQGVRLGKQRLFAGEAVAYFSDVVKNPGKSDDEPMTTFGLHFTQPKSNIPLEIGVATDGAPRNTWFKIDNFRLYKKR